MRYLQFDVSQAGDGVTVLEAMASIPTSTSAEAHAAVMAEVQQVLAWAAQRFPHSQGPLDDGNDWHHDLQLQVEEGAWHSVTLTLSGSDRFVADFLQAFPAPPA